MYRELALLQDCYVLSQLEFQEAFEQGNALCEEITVKSTELTVCYSKYLEISGIFLIWVMLIVFFAFLHLQFFVDILYYLASNVCN